MTQVVRICKYGCGIQLGEFDTKQNKYLETDGTLHTRERCESLKNTKNRTNTTQVKNETVESAVEQNRELKIAQVIKMVESVLGELKDLK